MSEGIASPERKKARLSAELTSASAASSMSTSWRQKCIDEFHLAPLPSTFLESDKTGKLLALSESSERTWERYYNYRMIYGPEKDKNKKEEQKKKADESDDSDYDMDSSVASSWDSCRRSEDPEGSLRHDVKMSLEILTDDLLEEQGKILDDDANADVKKRKAEARKFLIEAWTKHAVPSVSDATFDDGDDLRSADYTCHVFSPYAIPRAMVLEHCYHRRMRYSYSEFNVTWSFRLIRFDQAGARDEKAITIPAGKKVGAVMKNASTYDNRAEIKSIMEQSPLAGKASVGDRIIAINGQDTSEMPIMEITALIKANEQSERKLTLQASPENQPADPTQVQLEKRFPRGWNFTYPTICNYSADKAKEFLAWNEYLDPPALGSGQDIEDEIWVPVENQDVSNLTPATVRRIRGWLHGSPHESVKILNDFDFLNLLFAACGSGRNFSTEKGDIGHEWYPSRSAYHEEIEANVDYEGPCGVTWLEYQCRLISGALRPVDRYYEPYDVLEAKARWGGQVLDMEKRTVNDSDADSDEEENAKEDREVPWLVWQKKEDSKGVRDFVRVMKALNGGGF